MKIGSNLKKTAGMLACSFLLAALDQLTKWLAVRYLKDSDAVPLIPGVFELSYLQNRGSAFGMLQGQRLFFVAVALFLIVLIPFLYTRIPSGKRFCWLRIICVLLLAGAAGNAADRILHGYVVDFFYFVLIDFPVFNVADIYVTAGVFLFIVLVMFFYREEELSFLFPKKKDVE